MKNKNTLIWVGVASAVLIGGGIFWWMQTNKKKKEALKKKMEEEEQQKKLEEENKVVEPAYTPAPSYTPAPTFTFPFKSVDEGNNFRAWVNDTYPDYAKQIQLDRQGALNNYVQKAWDKLGSEYQKKDEKKDEKPSLSKLAQIKANLGSSVYPIQEYTDRIVATFSMDNKLYSGLFYSNDKFYLNTGNTRLNRGVYSDGGKRIVLDNGRVISSGSVWQNMKVAVTASPKVQEVK
jgi:hypothetical protein